MQVIKNCEVEWDEVRGVLYVHNKATGCTILRVSNLPKDRYVPNLAVNGSIDVRVESGYINMYSGVYK